MLSIPWEQRRPSYEYIVVGSGYGGAISAARIAEALNQPHSVCILERGKEWAVGSFPNDLGGILTNARSDVNSLGLFEFLNYRDISVIKGSGLGGTSLINANVALVPDPEVFLGPAWPKDVDLGSMQPYYDRAASMLAVAPVPEALDLGKVKTLEKRAQQIGEHARSLNLAVNFTVDGENAHGVNQRPCTRCGDCVTGCNVSAKNTLYMNYLPHAAAHGADIFTQTKVEWVEKLGRGGWRIHGQHYTSGVAHRSFTLDARNVILSAGAINSTEILLRSEMHGLRVSPAVGTGFSGNGDFFGLAYNGDLQTDVLGFGDRQPSPGESKAPGPSIVGAIKYNGSAPLAQRITVEDLSIPSAYVQAAKAVFGALRGEDTVVGNEAGQNARIVTDFDPASGYNPSGALNHTMLYLVMGQDNARGTMNFTAPWNEPDGRMTIEWDSVGQQVVFTRMNEELRRHARAVSGSFIANPLWSVFRARHLITAHPLGGCPMGDDYLHGAVDSFGRVYSGAGSVHDGLFVADGAILPSALGVNPLLTISALTERIAEARIRNAYPKPKTAVSMAMIDPLDVIHWSEAGLERLFHRSTTGAIERFVNRGTAPVIDTATATIRNDVYWKGFFPKGHILNAMSSAIFTGFRKAFGKDGRQYTGITSDTDGRIKARNSLEEVKIDRQTGTLEPGKYILLRYLDAPWTGFYDIFKMINDDLLIGRVYLGEYPNGARIFTFAMTRKYTFDEMTVDDHATLFGKGAVPSKEELNGVWRMDMISNHNHLGAAAYLQFDLKPDGRLVSRYELLGLIEGLVVPSFVQDHFQLNDFTPFHDEIRKVDAGLMVGKYVTGILPDLTAALRGADLGILHSTPGSRAFGFYYTLTRTDKKALPTETLLRPFLDVNLPDGVGLTFDEQMVGQFFEGVSTLSPGQAGGVACTFQVRMTVRDINEFVDGFAHQAGLKGTITFGALRGEHDVTFTVDEQASLFNYLIVNPETNLAEMRYHIEFRTDGGKRYALEGRKFMHRKGAGGGNAIRELLVNYTTLYCDVSSIEGGQLTRIGTALLKFRTFEDLAAVGNLAAFLGSFAVTGTSDPILKLQAQMRFLAFTGQFVVREYDPLAPDLGSLMLDVRGELARGAISPDYFSTQGTGDLQAILHDATTLPLEKLLNTGAFGVDFANRRIDRDLFWKGSFSKDGLLGWEERLRGAGMADAAPQTGHYFAGGAFWKRFDKVSGGAATGLVINYDLDAIPGDPEVRLISYPDDNRRYFRKGDDVLLLRYRNAPYQPVYDTIKIVDENNAIGVMHIGEFPNGVEFATFVLARYSYSFEEMSIEDHRLLFSRPDLSSPAPAQLSGAWSGNFVYIEHPNTSLMARPARAPLRLRAAADGSLRVLWDDGSALDVTGTLSTADMRLLGDQTLLGKWSTDRLSANALAALRDCIEPYADRLVLYYVLTRE